MNKNILHKRIMAAVAIICLSIAFTVIFSPYILKIENIFDYDANATSICIHVKDEVPQGSYGKEMRIVNMKINDSSISLEKYDNEGWIWHGEWGYTLYKDSDEDFVIDYFEPIESISFEYVEQEGSGVVEIYVGNKKIDELYMYRSSWYNNKKYYTFATESEKNFKYIEHSIFFAIILFAIFMVLHNILNKDGKKKYGVSSSLGMFDAAKGLSMVIIILGHTMTTLNAELEKSAGSILIILLAFFVATGLMPMFYMISGYGFRGEKNTKCIKKQLTFLLKPYFVMAVATVVCSLVKVAIISEYSMKDVKTLILSFISFNTINSSVRGVELISVGPIWFCIELCIAWILLNFIFKLKNKKAIYIAVALTVVAGSFIEKLPYNIHARTQFIPAVLFIFVGYLIRDKKIFQKENKYTCLQYIVVALIALSVIMFNGVGEAASNNMGRYYILGVLAATCMGVVLLRLYMILNSRINMKFFKRIGRNTYDIIYIHSFEYLVVPWDEIMNIMELPLIVEFIIVNVARCVLIYLIYMIVQFCRKMIRKNMNTN